MIKRILTSTLTLGMLLNVAMASDVNIKEKNATKKISITAEHLLDGTSMNYYYQNGKAIHLDIYDGKLKYKWIARPAKGKGNKDLPYKSRKIGNKMYLVSWLEESHPDYVTLVFNFNNNVMYSSGILRFGTKKQFTVFDGGIIEDLTLVEK